MPSMPWIKLYTEMLDDPKLGRMDDAIKWRFVSLCLLAGECDANGYLVNGDSPLTVEDIAWRMREAPATIGASMEAMRGAGLLSCEDGAWCVVAFEKRQGRPQSEKRRQWRERKQRQRERSGDTTGTTESVTRDSRVTHGVVTPLDQEGEERRGEGDQSAGADAPSPDGDSPPPVDDVPEGEQGAPTTFQEWSDLLQASKNRPADLVRMYEALYPGRDPPAFGYMGKVARQLGGAGRLAELLWQNSTRPPTGDVLAYCLQIGKRGKDNGNGTGTHIKLADEDYISSGN